MSLAARVFVLTKEGGLGRIPYDFYMEMLRQPPRYRLPAFANQRVRSAVVIVELADRKPIRVFEAHFYYLKFLERGVFDYDDYRKTELAKYSGYDLFARAGARRARNKCDEGNIIMAAPRFIARGGDWKSSAAERSAILEAALGRRRAPYLHRKTGKRSS